MLGGLIFSLYYALVGVFLKLLQAFALFIYQCGQMVIVC